MPTYRTQNLCTGAVSEIIAGNRKAAHEVACANNAGDTVEVMSLEEYSLSQLLKKGIKELRAWADAAYCELDEVTDVVALSKCLDAVEATAVDLKSRIEEIVRDRKPTS